MITKMPLSAHSKQQIQRLFKIYACIALVVLIFVTFFKIIKNHTESLPNTYFIGVRFLGVERGHTVMLKNSLLKQESVLVKQLIGMEGDRIYYDKNHHLWVAGTKVGALLKQDSRGKKLTPIAVGVIPKGYVFVCGTHTRSFDSRYSYFGLVPTENIMMRVFGV